MARKPRIHYPGAVYHVIVRGNAGQDIFSSDQDRYRFYLFLQEGQEKFAHLIHAFCLMTNHVHLILQVQEISLSRILQNLSQRYTIWVNWREGRRGHLFQGRYKAVLIDADTYLLELIRYIHLNPVRAGIVKRSEDYRWSSHRAYLGKENIPWLSTDWMLAQFSSRRISAQRRYREFINEEMEQSRREEFYGGPRDTRILGDDRFAEAILKNTQEGKERKLTPDEVLEKVCSAYGIPVEEVVAAGNERGPSQARGMICWLVREARHLSLTELSRRLNRDLSTLSVAAKRLVEKSKSDPGLRKRMTNLKSDLL